MELFRLYDLAGRNQIPVFRRSLPLCKSMSVQVGGSCAIAMDPTVCDTGSVERTHLSHELGHCITGSFYNRYAAVDHRRRHENRADKWAIRKLLTVDQLDDAIAEGCTELWQLADRFGVTEEFVKKAVCLYVHGNLATELYF